MFWREDSLAPIFNRCVKKSVVAPSGRCKRIYFRCIGSRISSRGYRSEIRIQSFRSFWLSSRRWSDVLDSMPELFVGNSNAIRLYWLKLENAFVYFLGMYFSTVCSETTELKKVTARICSLVQHHTKNHIFCRISCYSSKWAFPPLFFFFSFFALFYLT